LKILTWGDILDEDPVIVKIAEASYAEVYRVANEIGSSVIKIMRLQTPEDPDSLDLYNAIKVTNVISEIRIMNAMTELEGFVNFKDAHLIHGSPTEKLIDAYDEYNFRQKKENRSQFPHPNQYTKKSIFLAIELGDAGVVLDEFQITNIHQVWDIFLGAVMALAVGESAFEFEVSLVFPVNLPFDTF
jgi:serine/threonine-protein kinase haspin